MPNWKKGALQPGKRWGKVLYALLFVGILFAAVMYLRVTVNAPLGGDDCCNNPSGAATCWTKTSACSEM